MKRQIALLDFALGAIRRRAVRAATMVVGIAFVVGLYGSVVLLSESLRTEWRATLDSTPHLVVQQMHGGRPALIRSGERFGLESFPAVARIRPRVWGYAFVEAIGANVTVVGFDEEVRDVAVEAIDGSVPDANADVEQAIVGTALADRLGLRPGDRLTIPDSRGELVVIEASGVFRSSSALHAADVLVVDAPVARALLGIDEGLATDIAIDLTRDEEAAVVAQRVRDAMPTSRVIERDALVRTYELTFDGRAGMLAVFLLPCLAGLLLLGWDRLTGLGSNERREIGILKAIGWETRDVLSARIWESVIVSTGGAFLGAAFAYVYVYVLGAPGLAGALFGWSALYPELELAPAVQWDHLWTILGVVVLPYVAVSLVPAWRAATIDPDEAIR